jgi:hypothetical protein
MAQRPQPKNGTKATKRRSSACHGFMLALMSSYVSKEMTEKELFKCMPLNKVLILWGLRLAINKLHIQLKK